MEPGWSGRSGTAAATTRTSFFAASASAERSAAESPGSAADTVTTSAPPATAVCMPAATRSALVVPLVSLPRAARTRARWATPVNRTPSWAAAATRPATKVPCPTQSVPASPPAVTRPLSAGAEVETPVSTTPTVTPRPP